MVLCVVMFAARCGGVCVAVAAVGIVNDHTPGSALGLDGCCRVRDLCRSKV